MLAFLSPSSCLLLLLACRTPPPPPPLPAADIPADTMLLREWIPLRGPERSMGRRERFDSQGCWTMAPNTWLWVHDPDLANSTAPGLFWSGRFDDAPWFCLDPSARWRLEQALRALPAGDHVDLHADDLVAVRWTAVVDGRPRSFTQGLGRRVPETAALQDLLGTLAAEGAWGASPEGTGDGSARDELSAPADAPGA